MPSAAADTSNASPAEVDGAGAVRDIKDAAGVGDALAVLAFCARPFRPVIPAEQLGCLVQQRDVARRPADVWDAQQAAAARRG